jgi:hypothetical protein
MRDEEQCIRCYDCAGSCAKTLEQVVQILDDEQRDQKKATQMKRDWQEAEENFDKKAEGDDLSFDDDTVVNSHVRIGYKMSMRYGFITATEVEDDFGVSPKSIGLKLSERWNEDGTRLISGCCFRPAPGDELRYRVLENFYEDFSDKKTSRMKAIHRLRAKQPQEVLAKHAREAAAEHPAAFSGRRPANN